MTEIRISPRAYCKLILHAAKYPHCSVNGVLLSKKDSGSGKKGKSLVIVDAVPLFHICLHLVPMAEVALAQVDSVANAGGMVVSGYYTANEALNDTSIDKPATRIADKIAESSPSSCIVVIDNKRLTLTMEDPALRVLHCVDGKWKDVPSDSFFVDQESTEAAATLLQRHSDKILVDFDNHLDNLTHDWRNPRLNEDIDELVAVK